MSLAVVRTPGVATVQDGGRQGLAAVGVPTSGAWHRERYLLAVTLVAGTADERMPVIEILGGTLALQLRQAAVIAVTGAGALAVDGRREAVGACLQVPAGADLEVRHTGPGPCYLAIDGFAPASVLGSAATDTFSRLGPAPLAAGARLAAGPCTGAVARVGAFHRVRREPVGPLRVVPTGDAEADEALAEPWHVASVARSGVRLSGPAIKAAGDVPSMPMIPGAIQVTPAGEGLILGPDGGLTGGYPVVGVVATVDLDRVSLLAPGDRVSFRTCTLDEASAAWQDHQRALASAISHAGLLR